ncbi:F0F1 ATP synthase subunit A [Bombilactobacillus thymidiniphilus]|uniref:ATP synthase subunit a n=1 Tax=Bombilactobacillus thymidiniphilus TaxID=2923363 RepID=A0ABY4PEW9_9LACO|nr:F0F1 ATP synthase subunit A [Bombilactobacillus thymidiniphilus]UQS83847.1 F0F1 ATP synthase subunit A [Bombilactobacillus thymidiniphilus]
MNESYQYISFYGLTFNVANCLSTIITVLIVFGLFFFLSRKISLRPGKAQNLLEWIVDFTNGIVKNAIPEKREASPIMLYVFVMFAFIFVSNQLGLILQVAIGGKTFVKSPTADPIVAMSLGLIALVLSHYYGVQKLGLKGYLGTYIKPVGFLFPINLLEEFTNFLTLSLRLYGNIFAGEVLLSLIMQVAASHGWLTFVGAMPLSIIWQGFSVFIGAIQAYVFVTLSSVYISHKIESE